MRRKLRRNGREQGVEEYLVDQMKGWGFCLKLPANLWRGIPDRLIVIAASSKRRGRVVFGELKRPKGGKLSTAQRMWKKLLLDGGAEWVLLSSVEEVDAFLKEGDYDIVQHVPRRSDSAKKPVSKRLPARSTTSRRARATAL